MALTPGTDPIYTTIKSVFEQMNLYTEIPGAGNTSLEAVGTGNGTQTVFNLANNKVVDGSETIYVASVLKVKDTDYSINYDDGIITFLAGHIPGAVAITAGYWFSDLRSSYVSGHILESEDEINRKCGRSFYPSQAITNEKLDGWQTNDTNWFTYQARTFLDEMEAYRPLQEGFLLERTIFVKNFPILTVTGLLIDGATVAAANYMIYPNSGAIVLAETLSPTIKHGAQTVDISYTYGIAVVPKTVRKLCEWLTVSCMIKQRFLGAPVQMNVSSMNLDKVEKEIESLFTAIGRQMEVAII